MPYIKQAAREHIDGYGDGYGDATNAGELNYLFTVIAHSYWQRCGQNYQAFNDIIGAIEGAKLELYRRKVGPYEDLKIAENGDV